MEQRGRGSAALVVIIVLAGIVLAAANVAALLIAVKGAFELPALGDVYRAHAAPVIYLIVGPIVFGIVLALLAAPRVPAAAAPDASTTEANPSAPVPPSPEPALRLLGLLQQEGRFIDFIKEDLDAYSDEQVGTAVRSIHAGCRKALNERIELERIFADEDGSEVVVGPGFDPATVRLTGNVAGEPPFRGTLQHGGWRAAKVKLPQSPGGTDPTIIAPAEVEIP